MKKGLIVLVMALVAAVAFAAPISFTVGAALDYNKNAEEFFDGTGNLKDFSDLEFGINDFTFGGEVKAHVFFTTLDVKVDASPVAEAEAEAPIWEKFDYRASVGAGVNADLLMFKVSALAGVTAESKWHGSSLEINGKSSHELDALDVLLTSKVFAKVAVDAKISDIVVGVQATVTPEVMVCDLLAGDLYDAGSVLKNAFKDGFLPYTSVGAYVGINF